MKAAGDARVILFVVVRRAQLEAEFGGVAAVDPAQVVDPLELLDGVLLPLLRGVAERAEARDVELREGVFGDALQAQLGGPVFAEPEGYFVVHAVAIGEAEFIDHGWREDAGVGSVEEILVADGGAAGVGGRVGHDGGVITVVAVVEIAEAEAVLVGEVEVALDEIGVAHEAGDVVGPEVVRAGEVVRGRD